MRSPKVTDILAERLLLKLRDDGDVTMLLDRYIKPPAVRRQIPFVETLAAFLEHGCNASESARALSISRQSLLYRLARIESLLKSDLRNADQRFTISLALRLHKFQRDR